MTGVDTEGPPPPNEARIPDERNHFPFLGRAAFVVGSLGLVCATFADAFGVAGRHLGIPFIGSIELVQLAVVFIASAAVVIATIEHAHASVHIFTERMKPATADFFSRFSMLLGAALLLLITAGSIWIAAELWAGHERTELLHIPLRLPRIVWIGAALTAAALFILQAARRGRA